MSFFLAFALLLSLTAVFGVVNERYLRLEPSIGLMLLAILMTFALAALKVAGVFDALSGVQALVQKLDLSEVGLGLLLGLALALALSLPPSAQKPLIINMIFAVVAFSILVQGSTISKLFTPTYLKTILKPDRS